MTSTEPKPDDVIIARAIENGWQQTTGKISWPGSKGWDGWERGGHGIPVGTFQGPNWKTVDGNRVKVSDGPYTITWADAMRDALDHDDRCNECGLWIEYMYMTLTPPAAHCWHCQFWLSRIAPFGEQRKPTGSSRPGRPFVAVSSFGASEGERRGYYSIGTTRTPSSHNGFGGSWFVVTFTDGTEMETCDLWSGGDVPERFHDRLPVTASVRGGRLVSA